MEAMCEPVQYSDTVVCRQCGISWDAGDPNPPRCPREIIERGQPVMGMIVWLGVVGLLGAAWFGVLGLLKWFGWF